MEMLNRAIDGAALYKDMMRKVEDGTAPAAPADPQVAAWNAEVERARHAKMERKINARLAAQRDELMKAMQR